MLNEDEASYLSRPASGLLGSFELAAYDSEEEYLFGLDHGYRSSGNLLKMAPNSVFGSKTPFLSIESLRISYEYENAASSTATLSFGLREGVAIVDFELGKDGVLDLSSGLDFSAGYSHFWISTPSSLLIDSIEIGYGEDARALVGLDLTIGSKADYGTKLSDLLTGNGVLARFEDGSSRSLSASEFTLSGSHDGTPFGPDTILDARFAGTISVQASYLGLESHEATCYVYDFDNPPSVESIVPSIDELTLYVGEGYEFDYTVHPSNLDPSLIGATSLDPSLLSLDGKRVRALQSGETEILINGGDKSSSIHVSIIEESGVEVSPTIVRAYDWSNDYAPALGEQKILIVPITLEGTSTYSWDESTLDQIEDSTFGVDNPESLVNFYDRASNGRLRLSGEVYGGIGTMYQAEYREGQLINDSSMDRLYAMFEDCLAWLYDRPDIDLDDYDSDDDGYIDSIHFFVDGYDREQWNSSLWPHMGTMKMDAGSKERPTIMSYSLSNLGHVSESALTTIHEQGHIYGVEDYYDYSYYMDLTGYFDMQNGSYGDWNALSKMQMGWVDPIYVDLAPGEECDLVLKPSALGASPLILKEDWNGSAYDEYIMAELLGECGNNAFFWEAYSRDATSLAGERISLGDGGVRLSHVDARLWASRNGLIASPQSGHYVEDLAELGQEGQVYQLAHNNTYYADEYPTFNVSAPTSTYVSRYYLYQVIQEEGTDTFSNPYQGARHYLDERDLFETGDSFSFDEYSTFFKETTMNDGTSFPYRLSFTEVTPEEARIHIERI